MLRQRAKLVAFSLYLCDLILVVTAFLSAYWARDTFLSVQYGRLSALPDYLWLLFLILPLWSFLLYYFGLYQSFRARPIWVEPWAITKAVVWGTLLVGTSIFVFKLHYVSRLFIVMFGATTFIFLSTERLVIRAVARQVRQRGLNYRNIIIVGTGRRAREIAQILEDHKHWGLRLIGIVSDGDGSHLPKVGHYPIIGHIDRMPEILQHQVVDEVIFAVSRKKLEEMEEIFLLCEELGIRTRVAVNFFPHMIAKVHLDDLHGVPLLTFTTTPYNEFQLILKRAFDLAISCLLLVLFFPFFLVISMLIKLSSKGPIFFKQTRVGLNGRQFTLYKFRSMVRDAEQKKQEIASLNEAEGPVFKMEDDPRVTTLGRFLRKTSMDELPQLINVIRGDMSLVGPRPPLPDEVKSYKRWQRRRLSMKPGLTCLWQISGRNAIKDFNKWMELDLQYIDNWSLSLDVKIIIKTIPAVLLCRGAS